MNPTIPANCTFPWIAGVSTFSVLWAPKWIRTEEAHSVWVRLRLHGKHHTSFVRPEDKQHRCSAVGDAQQGRHQHRKWKEAADDSWLQRHQMRSGYLWQDRKVLHVSKVNQTVANETSSSSWMQFVGMLPLSGLWPIRSWNAKSRTNDVHSCPPLRTTWRSQCK